MFGWLKAAPRLVVASLGLLASGSLQPASAAPEAVSCESLSSLSAIVEVLRKNGIDPLIATPAGPGPLAVAMLPVDSDAAEQAAQAFQLRRLEPAGEGESRETMILPRI